MKSTLSLLRFAAMVTLHFVLSAPLFAADTSTVKDVAPDEAEKLLKAGAKVVDVRTPEEFKSGHIKGASNVDFHGTDFAAKVNALPKNEPVILHCAAGGRSTKALETLKAAGFGKIYHLKGGFSAWEDAGKPVEK